MANLITNDDLDNTKPKPAAGNGLVGSQAPSITNQNSTQAQTPSVAGQNMQNSAQQQGQAQQRKGTGFTNINRVLQANQGNRLGQAIGGGINQSVQGVRQNLQGQQQQFNQQTGEQKSLIDQDRQIKNQALQSLGGQGAEADYDSLAGKANDFARIREGTYTGPRELQNAANIQAQAQEAQFLGNALNQEGGRQVLLQRFAGGPQYTQGQQRVDNLLLGQQVNPLRQARVGALGIGNQTANQINAAALQGKALETEKSQLGQQTTDELGQANTKFQGDLNAKVADAQQRQVVESQRYKDILSGKAVATDDDLKNFQDMGLDLNQGLYGVDLTSNEFLSNKNANINNVANASDYAKYNALNKLSGQSGTLLSNDRSQAGEFDKGPIVNLNSDQAKARIQAAQEQFDATHKGQAQYSQAADILKGIMDPLNSAYGNDAGIDAEVGKDGSNTFRGQYYPDQGSLRQAVADAKKQNLMSSFGGSGQDYASKIQQAQSLINQSGLYNQAGDNSWFKMAGLNNLAGVLQGNYGSSNYGDYLKSAQEAQRVGSAIGQGLESDKQAGGAYDSLASRQAALKKMLEQQATPSQAPTVGV